MKYVFNVGPPSYVSWFMNSTNQLVRSIIQTIVTGVMPADLAIVNGGPTLFLGFPPPQVTIPPADVMRIRGWPARRGAGNGVKHWSQQRFLMFSYEYINQTCETWKIPCKTWEMPQKNWNSPSELWQKPKKSQLSSQPC